MGDDRRGSYRFRNLKSGEICPICGHKDWCSRITSVRTNVEYILCQRAEHTDTCGYDGNFYVFDREPEGSSAGIFEEANQRYQRLGDKKKEFKKQEEKPRQMTVIDGVSERSHDHLDKVYRTLLEHLVLDDDHRAYLRGEGWTDDLIDRHQIKSFPEKDYLRFKRKNSFSKNKYRKTLCRLIIEKLKNELGELCLKGVPGFYMDSKGEWTINGPKGILFPVYDTRGRLYRLRIRMDFKDVDEDILPDPVPHFIRDGRDIFISMSGRYSYEDGIKVYEKNTGKYRNLSSYFLDEEEYKRGFVVNTLRFGCESGNRASVYMNPARDNMFCCWVTEGEKKGIMANDRLRAPVISLPGVNSFCLLTNGQEGHRMIDELMSRGVSMFIIAFDADKNENAAVMKAQQGAVEILKKAGLRVGLAEWNGVDGKGLDDLLVAGHSPSFVAI